MASRQWRESLFATSSRSFYTSERVVARRLVSQAAVSEGGVLALRKATCHPSFVVQGGFHPLRCPCTGSPNPGAPISDIHCWYSIAASFQSLIRSPEWDPPHHRNSYMGRKRPQKSVPVTGTPPQIFGIFCFGGDLRGQLYDHCLCRNWGEAKLSPSNRNRIIFRS